MSIGQSQSNLVAHSAIATRQVYGYVAVRAHSVIIFGALFCTLAVKLFQAYRISLVNDYFRWVLADISVLLMIEVILALICFRWARIWVLRAAAVVAAVVCTWSVMNAGWLIRTGTQILPRVLLPVIRDPLNAFLMIGVNLAKMPIAATILLAPSTVGLGFLFYVLAKPRLPVYNRKRFAVRIAACLVVALAAAVIRPFVGRRGSPHIASVGLPQNAQVRAVVSLFHPRLVESKREVPYFDQVQLALKTERVNHNVVIVVLEGIQYVYTSLADRQSALTPYLAGLAGEGVEFANTRSSVTHTTKALFALLTGRFPSASQDLAEAVPAVKPYASLVTVLRGQLGFRTAFFQSAKGDFETRPGLIHNLGFQKFWARDDLNDPNSFIAYLACDEFAMLEPITEWIKQDSSPFLLTILCSVAHDPYEVPDWFAEPAKEPVERYRQTISYTDRFLEALDVELAGLNLAEKTIFCVIGDHGEAFGEHGLLGHERIAFDEVLRVPFCIRAPLLVQGGTKVPQPVSSIDLTPTLLGLLGFETEGAGFDGLDALGAIPDGRKVYFSGWMREGPGGFVVGNRKFVYNPADKTVCLYDLAADPGELVRRELPEKEAQKTVDSITAWRKNSIFRIHQQQVGRKLLFDRWLCRRRTSRFWSAKYQPGVEN